MADQTQRLEIATVKAEIGSDILSRFSNDAVTADPIPTDSGNIQNLKQVIVSIQEDGAEKISFATTIYSTTAAGIAATTNGAIFLVKSDEADEIYAVWQNVSGVATDTGKRSMAAQAIQDAMQSAMDAAQAAEDSADLATARTARFLASVSTPPVIRDDGTPLQLGDRYVNTENQAEYIYKASGWAANDSLVAIDDIQDPADPAKGAAKVGYDGGTAQDILDYAKPLASYAAFRAYMGRAKSVCLTNAGIAGQFYRDDADTTSADNGGTTIVDALGRRWKRQYTGTVLVNWFDDGIVNHSVAFQAALNTGAKRVVADPNGIYTLPTGIVSSAPGQKLILTGAVLTLTSSVLTTRAIMMTGDQSRLVGGEITSTQRMNMLVTAGGKDCRIEGAEVYFAAPPNRYPLDENTIVYNQGGIELIGVGSSATDNEVYNLMGMGIISYHADQKIEKNHCHHNGMGAHVNHAEPGVVSVRDNIFENNDSIGVLANQDGVVLSFYGNTLRGNGSHGAYLRCQRSMVGLNIAYSNYRYGIKVRDATGTVVFANSTFYNNVAGTTSGIELTLQINELGATGVDFVANTAKSTDTALTQSFAINWAGSSQVNDRMTLVGNTFENASAAYSSAPVIVGNKISGALTLATAVALAPATQINALVSSNYIGALFASNRCDLSHIAHNMIGVMTTPIDGATKFNRVMGNVLYNQNLALERRFFEEFSGNRVKITATLATPVFKQANNASENSNKTITNNRVTGNTTALIADNSTAVSGNSNNISGNISDLPAGISMISMWGTGHTMIGNINTAGGATGYVGATNSWLVGNSPKMALRAEGTGNQNI